MATTAKNSTTKSRSTAAKKAAETRAENTRKAAAKRTATAKKAAQTRLENERNVAEIATAYVRQTAERAVDVPVGAALAVAEQVKPLTDTASREREMKRLRTQVTREINKLERRGGQARRKAQTRVRGT
ncbi:MAG: hypothetical protein WKF62_02890, partial [Solirubrobacterales bacterium]